MPCDPATIALRARRLPADPEDLRPPPRRTGPRSSLAAALPAPARGLRHRGSGRLLPPGRAGARPSAPARLPLSPAALARARGGGAGDGSRRAPRLRGGAPPGGPPTGPAGRSSSWRRRSRPSGFGLLASGGLRSGGARRSCAFSGRPGDPRPRPPACRAAAAAGGDGAGVPARPPPPGAAAESWPRPALAQGLSRRASLRGPCGRPGFHARGDRREDRRDRPARGALRPARRQPVRDRARPRDDGALRADVMTAAAAMAPSNLLIDAPDSAIAAGGRRAARGVPAGFAEAWRKRARPRPPSAAVAPGPFRLLNIRLSP